MKKLLHKYKTLFSNKEYVTSFILTFVLLIGSLIINYYAGIYATEKASNAVTDIILSNTRVYDLDWLFIYAPIVMWVFITFLCFSAPKRLPFALKSVALFTIIRAIFISLTHIGPFYPQLVLDSTIVNKFTFGGDLFFSGHTGLPFLMALVFWNDKRLRILFILLSIMFGIVVLLSHLHYSIDVFSAFFITYTIYHISAFLFKKDLQRLEADEV